MTDSEFEQIVAGAIDNVPEPYRSRINNVAFLVEDEPSEQQRLNLKLRPEQTLFGLYEGVPLPQRGGSLKILPDKITIFKQPILQACSTVEEVKEQVGKTIWHEVAHYFGLDHNLIHKLENKPIK
jgi:predicted Zn-dependent protease with MMP-like domain